MIDRIRKTQGLLSDKWLLFGVLYLRVSQSSPDSPVAGSGVASGKVTCYRVTRAEAQRCQPGDLFARMEAQALWHYLGFVWLLCWDGLFLSSWNKHIPRHGPDLSTSGVVPQGKHRLRGWAYLGRHDFWHPRAIFFIMHSFCEGFKELPPYIHMRAKHAYLLIPLSTTTLKGPPYN